jgi:hypothetical protein
MPSQYSKQAENPDRSNVKDLIAIPSYFDLLETIAQASESTATAAACAFCNARIPYGQSICPDCMKKYNIRAFDMGNDGCGCDR